MDHWIRIWMYVVEFSALAYLLLMLILSVGWYLTKSFIPTSNSSNTKVSIVVAVRNEAENIRKLLISILNQTYAKELFELIIVDDDSDDSTIEKINEFKKSNPNVNLKVISSSECGKKEALKQGLDVVENSIVILTDGDCTVGSDWISNYVSCFEQNNVQLIFGPVFYFKSKTLLKRIFSLEFSTLVASGAASAGIGLPLMGNGANISFRKEAYDKVSKKQSGQEFASGDDVFLIHAIAKHYGRNSVKFLKHNNSVVETSSPENFSSFVNQRVRWGSKAKAYKNIWPVIVSLIVLLFNVIMGITALLSVFKLWFLALYLLLVLLKFLIDFPFTTNFLRFFNRIRISYLLLPLELLYPFYIMFTAIFSLFIPFRWKGRNVTK
jgi:cellulose synthase/poly-beta-1,6-N-acetylglucosamine synthase-like glycosyltransferase